MAKKKDPTETLANLQAAQLAAQVANWAAQLEFQKERMRLLELPQFAFMSQMEIDKLAFQKAEAEYKRALEESSVTGMYNGQPTLQWLEQQARLTGVINGQQTLEGKLSEAQIAQMNHQMQLQSRQQMLEDEKFGFERERWGAEFSYQQQKDLRDYELQQAGLTGYTSSGQATLEREQMQGSQAQAYLGLMASLQSNPFKQARVLQNTPNGLRSVADAWAGKFQLASQTGVGPGPGPAQMSDLTTQFDPNTGLPLAGQNMPGVYFQQPVQGVNGGQPGQAPLPGNPLPTPPVTPPVTVQPVPTNEGPLMWNGKQYVPTQQAGPTGLPVPGGQSTLHGEGPLNWTGGTYQYNEGGTPVTPVTPGTNPAVPGYALDTAGQGYTVSPPGVAAPTYAYNYQTTPTGQTQVYPPGVQAPVQGVQVSTTTPQTANAQASINPGRINAKNYANTNEAMKQLGWMQIEEEQGISQTMAKDAFKRSLPKYGGPKTGRVQMAGAA